MNILVTGGAGFIGSFVVEQLRALGHTVNVVDSLEPRVHRIDHYTTQVPAGTYIAGVRDIPYHLLMEAEVVIHLAAQVGVADSMKDPLRYLEQNTSDTARMLIDMERHFARGTLKRLVVASSMSVYGAGGTRVSEDHAVCPASVYGLSKYDQERLCLMWGERWGIPTAALRFFNVFGPRQQLENPYTGVLANFAKRYLIGQPPIIYEDGQQTRDFIYVADVARAVILAATGDAIGVFNVCTGEATTIYQVARLLGNAVGRRDIEPTITHTQRPGDIRHCTGDPTKAMRELGFKAQTTVEDGMTQYGAWLLR